VNIEDNGSQCPIDHKRAKEERAMSMEGNIAKDTTQQMVYTLSGLFLLS
jgi:hypothetical protein